MSAVTDSSFSRRLRMRARLATGLAAGDTGSVAPVRAVLAAELQPDVARQRLSERGLDVLGRLGSGGMGEVFRARQQSVERAVAVKTLRPEFAEDRERVEAFVREAVVTGNLDHPNIVPVHDVGRAAEVGAYCIMKEVQGVSWDQVMGEKTERQNLEILLEVCDAVAFAHHHGVLHRDLKPENVMLGEYGEVVVMDWGIAAAAADVAPTVNVPRLSPDSEFLEGTPEYMAPEMACHDVPHIGTRSDVYLLGALLYQIVTGLPPHAGADPETCLRAAMANAIQPTSKAGELVDIAVRAMATDPAARHASVKEFQAAVREYLEHAESMDLSRIAREDLDAAERTQDYNRFAQALFGFREALKLWPGNARAARGASDAALRYAGCAAARQDFDLAVSLLDVEDAAHFQQRQVAVHGRRMRQVRARRLHLLTRLSGGLGVTLMTILATASVWIQFERVRAVAARDRAVAAEAAARVALQKSERENYYNVVNLARSRIESGQLRVAGRLLDTAPAARRGWEWSMLKQLCEPRLAEFTVVGRDTLADLSLSADGTRVAAAGPGSTVRVWESTSQRPRLHLATYPGPIADVALAPDGGAVCFATGSRAVLWDLAAPEERRVFQAGDAALTDVAFAPSGTWLATADERGAVRLWTVRTGRELRSLEGHAGRVNAVTFSSDSRQVFSAGADGALRVWTVSSGNLRKCYTGHAGGALCVAVSGDGALAAVGLGDGTVRVWDLREHEVQRIFDAHAAAVTGLCFAPDSARLASVSADGTARVFDLATGHAIKAMCDRNDTGAAGNDNAAGFAAVAFAPDGARVFTAGGPGRNAVWDCCHALTGTMTEVVADTNLYRSQRLADGTALCPRGGSIEVAPGVPPGAAAALGTPIVTGHARAVTATTFSPDGRRFVTVSTDQTVKLWDVATRREVLTLSAVPLRSYTDVAFSADGCTLFASDGRGASVWDAVPRSTVNTEESRQ